MVLGAGVAVLTVHAAGQPAGGPAASGNSAIEGRVVLKGTSQPLAGITIQFFSSSRRPVTTDAEGRFAFDGLPAGPHLLVVNPTSGYRGEVRLVLRESQKLTGVEIKAYPGATISGRVRDAKDRPVPGLRVSALQANSAGRRMPPGRGMAGLTNDMGEYKLSGLSPGRYLLLVETERATLSTREWVDDEKLKLPAPMVSTVRTYYPNALSQETAAVFQLAAGQSVEALDVTLAQTDTYCVRTKVQRPAAQAAERVHVQVVTDAYLGAAVMAEGEATLGGFEVCRLPQGSYTVLATAGEEPDVLHASSTFSLTDSSLRIPDLTLAPLVKLAGRLTVDTPSGAKPKPLPGGIGIQLMATGRPFARGQRTFTQVSESGPFVIPAVLPAEYTLNVYPPAGFYVKSATADGRDALREPLYAGCRELHIVLGQDGAQVAVVVTETKDSAPVAGARVIVARDPLPEKYVQGELMTAITDQNGSAMIAGLAPGPYRVLAFADTVVVALDERPRVLQNRVKGEFVDLGPDESRTLTIHPVDQKE